MYALLFRANKWCRASRGWIRVFRVSPPKITLLMSPVIAGGAAASGSPKPGGAGERLFRDLPPKITLFPPRVIQVVQLRAAVQSLAGLESVYQVVSFLIGQKRRVVVPALSAPMAPTRPSTPDDATGGPARLVLNLLCGTRGLVTVTGPSQVGMQLL
jgi:hypothetical protein